MSKLTSVSLPKVVKDAIANTTAFDLHTHLFPPQFSDLFLSGFSELLDYHYLLAEFFRYKVLTPEEFYALDKKERSELIWRTLFIDRSPLSDASWGVLRVLRELNIPIQKNFDKMIQQFEKKQKEKKYYQKIFELAKVDQLTMTNDPLDPIEEKYWNAKTEFDKEKFLRVLRIDSLLSEYEKGVFSKRQVLEFLKRWIDILAPVYVAISLAPETKFSKASKLMTFLKEILLPILELNNIPLALMIGVHRQVNPSYKLAGDSSGKFQVSELEYLLQKFPKNKFLVTLLSRENQHELTIAARKFSNLMPFGCWWFVSIHSIMKEIETMRFELLGSSFIPQHSDARVFEQIIYKWQFLRESLTNMLTNRYQKLLAERYPLTEKQIQNDITRLLMTNAKSFLNI